MDIKDKLSPKTKLDTSIEAMLGEQIKREAESSFLYQRISQAAYEANYIGTYKFFNKRADEELSHMRKIIDYINHRGCHVKPYSITPKEFKFDSLLGCMQAGLEHEQFITKSLTEIGYAADAKKDVLTRSFLEWFFIEQIEEEKMFIELIKQLSIFGDCKCGNYLFDNKLNCI